MRESGTNGLRRPLLKYFGSKFRSAKHYPAPRYSTIIEPFTGGAGYSCLYPDRSIQLFDLNPELIELWQWLISGDTDEILALPVEVPVGTDIRTLDISNGAKLLIRAWQRVGRNDCWTISQWNNLPGQWQESVKSAIAESLPHIRHWRAECLDYRQIPLAEATWFIDPPYQHVKGYKFESINYSELAEWVKSLPGQVIVCEQEKANWLPFRQNHTVLAANRGVGKSRANRPEYIWTNEI